MGYQSRKISMLVTVSSKGQITIPQALRESHGIFPRMKGDISATALASPHLRLLFHWDTVTQIP